MNYLAHFYLGGDTPAALAGSLLGDYARGSRLEGYDEAICRGIRLHRRIDAFTDAHPVTAASRGRVGAANRRYAGILVDIFYDHFLARHWADYSPTPLAVFAPRVYAALQAPEAPLPDPLRGLAARMAAGDWLRSYAAVEGIDAALARVARRIRRENSVAGAVADLLAGYAGFEADFRQFFPALAAHVAAVEAAAGSPDRRDVE